MTQHDPERRHLIAVEEALEHGEVMDSYERKKCRELFEKVSDDLEIKQDNQSILVGVNLNDAYGFSVAEFNAGDQEQSRIDAEAFVKCRTVVLDLLREVDRLSVLFRLAMNPDVLAPDELIKAFETVKPKAVQP